MPESLKDGSWIAKLTKQLPKLVIAGAILLLLVSALFFWKFFGPLSDSPQDWASFGDYVGGVLGPIFGLFTLVVVVAAFFQQHKEMVNSVEQLKETVAASKSQVEMLRKQSFENTFFRMLSLHNEIVDAIELRQPHVVPDPLSGLVKHEEKVYRGRQALYKLMNQFHQRLREPRGGDRPSLGGESYREAAEIGLEEFLDIYGKFYETYQSQLGHYFRFLYNIIKYVDHEPSIDRSFYSNLVRAQLSTPELTLIFCNCLSVLGREKFKPLIERYALLKTLPDKEFFGRHLLDFYEQGAYGN